MREIGSCIANVSIGGSYDIREIHLKLTCRIVNYICLVEVLFREVCIIFSHGIWCFKFGLVDDV